MDDLRRGRKPAGRAIGFEAARAEKVKLRAIEDGITLRPYRKEDRPQVERICLLTGLRGELDELFCDRPLFLKLWLVPYLDGEPEHTVVAEKDGEIVGYLVGTVRPDFIRRSFRLLFPHLLTLTGRWLTGRYRHHPASGRFARWLLTRSWRELPKTPKNTGNFHFNIDPAQVSTLVGERLIARFEDFVEEVGQKGWHAILFSSPKKRPVAMYERMGFEVFDRVPCTLFPTGDVESVCIYKPLDIWVAMTRVPRKQATEEQAD